MTDFDDEDAGYRERRRRRVEPRPADRRLRDPRAEARPMSDDDGEDWQPADNTQRRSARDPHPGEEEWDDDEDADIEPEDDTPAPRRPSRTTPRRDSLMQRRLRVARGEDPDMAYDA